VSAFSLRHPVAFLADRLGVTEGQAYTLVIGIVVATLLAVAGIPPTLRDVAPLPLGAPALGVVDQAQAIPVEVASDMPSVPPPSRVPLTGARTGPAPAAPTAVSEAPAGTPTARPPGAPPAIAFGTTTVFARTADDAAPHGIAVATDGSVYVGAGRHVLAYDADGVVARAFAPDAGVITGVALDGDGGLLVLDAATPRLLRLDLSTGAATTVATIPDVGRCVPLGSGPCEPGLVDHPPAPWGVVLAGGGTMYVTDRGQGTIWRIDADGTVTSFLSAADFATGDGPAGIAVDRDATVWFTAGTTIDADNPLAGGVYRLSVDGDGRAGTPELVYAAADSGPAGVALGASGNLYVTLHAADALAVIAADGEELARVTSSGPAAVAFRGRSVIVSSPAAGELLDIHVDDHAG